MMLQSGVAIMNLRSGVRAVCGFALIGGVLQASWATAQSTLTESQKAMIKSLGGEVAASARFGQGTYAINLFGKSVGDAELRELASFGGMSELNLALTNITDAGIAHLENCRGLRSINVGGTKVTDSSCQHLARIESLVAISFLDTRVTDQGIKKLEQHQRLEQLFLGL